MSRTPSREIEALPPSAWVRRFLEGVPAAGTMLDVACGGGRHMRLALDHGHPVVGIDRDLDGVRDLLGRKGVELVPADLEDGVGLPTTGRRFAGVVVTRYLWRPILSAIIAAVADDGILIYETFAVGHEQVAGRPSKPDFLLGPNELVEAAISGGLTVVAFEHGGATGPRPGCIQRIAAVGRRHVWALEPWRAPLGDAGES